MNIGDKIGPKDATTPTHEIIEERYGYGDRYVTVRCLKTSRVEPEGIDSYSFDEWKVFDSEVIS
jgi:hypothetical protein